MRFCFEGWLILVLIVFMLEVLTADSTGAVCTYCVCIVHSGQRERKRERVFKMDAIHIHWEHSEGGNQILSLNL